MSVVPQVLNFDPYPYMVYVLWWANAAGHLQIRWGFVDDVNGFNFVELGRYIPMVSRTSRIDYPPVNLYITMEHHHF